MAKKPKKKKSTPPKLRVAFDTNILYTHVAHNLLQREAKEFIETNSDHTDLKIEWYLSDVVTGERQYQMRQSALGLHEKVEQLERLLGHQLTTMDIISDRIRSTIDEQLSSLGIKLLGLNPEDVDWEDVIRRSVNRLPPFDPKIKEKGFRDAVIAEAFIQLVSASPTTTATCRMAFVSNDEMLRRYVEERTQGRQNVRVLEGLNDLEGLINTLVSQVPEERIAEWQKKAAKYFFEKNNENCWFKKEDIREKLWKKFSSKLLETPEGNFTREDGTWYISAPVFIRKERQRLYWMTEIDAQSKLLRISDFDSSDGRLFNFGSSEKNSTSLDDLLTTPSREEAGTAKSTMEVHWSVSVSAQRETLSQPRIDELRFVDTEFKLPDKNAILDFLIKYKKWQSST